MIVDEVFGNRSLEDNFKKRRIDVKWFETFEDITTYLSSQIPVEASIGIGNSQTLKKMKILETFLDKGNTVYDKTIGKTLDEIKMLKRQALLTDYYISSANAISVDGRIINIDHSGNRVAAMHYGPEKVFLIVGKNKIESTYEEALKRARNTAAPLNAKRAGMNPPCVEIGKCVDCLSPERVCNFISIIEGQHIDERLTLLIANEEAGF